MVDSGIGWVITAGYTIGEVRVESLGAGERPVVVVAWRLL